MLLDSTFWKEEGWLIRDSYSDLFSFCTPQQPHRVADHRTLTITWLLAMVFLRDSYSDLFSFCKPQQPHRSLADHRTLTKNVVTGYGVPQGFVLGSVFFL
ncbi:hypothetical protein J6590_084768 [Homalodisca vitripennis]|nr:hypothetical protein J6590_084768 [Homalodisca vitripennis]